MCQLSPKEEEILEGLLTARPSVVAIRLGITKGYIGTVKSRAKRKEAKAKKFLRNLKKYRLVLHPEKEYKGI